MEFIEKHWRAVLIGSAFVLVLLGLLLVKVAGGQTTDTSYNTRTGTQQTSQSTQEEKKTTSSPFMAGSTGGFYMDDSVPSFESPSDTDSSTTQKASASAPPRGEPPGQEFMLAVFGMLLLGAILWRLIRGKAIFLKEPLGVF